MSKKLCITCCNEFSDNQEGCIIFNDLYICEKCLLYIVEMHLYNNNSKWLCCHCNSDPRINCQYCDLSIKLKNIKKISLKG